MTIPSLDSFTDLLIQTTDAVLETTIQYAPAGGSHEPVQAWVEYGETFRDGVTGMIVDGDITVKISKLQVADRPNSQCRLILPRLAAISFAPVNVTDLGTDWSMGVQSV